MAKVTYNKYANGSVWRYGKGQSILVDSFEKKTKLGKSKSIIAHKVKAAWKLVKSSSKIAGIKIWGFTEASENTTSREARSNPRSACKKKLTQ